MKFIDENQFQAYYFDRDDVALPGMHWYFKHASDEEREHAMKLLKYLNKRGGRIILEDIKNPEAQGEMTAVEAMTKALELEKEVNEVREVIKPELEKFSKLKIFNSLFFESYFEFLWLLTLPRNL